MNRLFAFIILLALGACSSPKIVQNITSTPSIDWQGHRGARGLRPENTLPAFLHALSYPAVRTLELDVAVTSDGQVVVSHEPWMSATICSHPDGRAVDKGEEQSLRIYQMTLAEVQAFDCGQRGHPNFPQQQPIPAIKPTLEAVIQAAEAEVVLRQRPLPFYNVEIKSLPEWDDTFTPLPAAFASRVLAVLQRMGVSNRTTVQSFDVRSLQAVRAQAPTQPIAYLIANKNTWSENINLLGFKPDIYSPYFELVTAELVKDLHAQGIAVIPWTVNDTAQMKTLIALGVDGIITDYPDRIPR